MGNFYYNGEITGQNKEKACRWWLKAADKGLAEAQYKTGNCYEAGIISVKAEPKNDKNSNKKEGKKGKEKNENEPVKSWLKAAEQGHVEAQNKIADCYYYGKCGLEKSEKNAKKWLKKSVGKGNEDARKKSVEWFVEDMQWSNKSPDTMTWYDAEKYCDDLDEKGFSDWRLPTISELRKIIQNCSGSQSTGYCKVNDNCLSGDCWSDSCYCDSIDNNNGYYSVLGDDDGVVLWSSATMLENSNRTWVVSFYDSKIANSDNYDKSYVRCVR